MLIRICDPAIRRSLVAEDAKWQMGQDSLMAGELTAGGKRGGSSGRGRGSGWGSTVRITKVAKLEVLQWPMLAWSLDV